MELYPCTSYIPDVPSVTTIAEWLERNDEYYSASHDSVLLAHFKEHIYTRNQDGSQAMTFVGYGRNPYVDFLFYDPQSDGDKVVDFDVDSSKVNTHTLTGSGFWLNTNVGADQYLHGYLVYYVYEKIGGSAQAKSVTIYQVDGVKAVDLHEGSYDFKDFPASMPSGFTELASVPITDWEAEMSIQIKATPDRIEVRQQPKSKSGDISQCTPILEQDLPAASKYSGFGPLVAYTTDGQTHYCPKASSFTYSNLRMYYTNPELEKKDMLNALEEADFTQEGTQKYFINLFGESDLAYNDTANFGQYQEYMKMMQIEGIALITDRETPFDPYLGVPDDPYSNLIELQGSGKLSVDELIEKIKNCIPDDRTTTRLDDKLANPPEAGGVAEPTPGQSVGNIWLKSQSDVQIRETLQGAAFGDGGYEIRIIDDIAYYHGDQSGLTVSYNVLKPGKAGYTPLGTGKPNEVVSFTVTNNTKDWPSGTYVVRQTISGSSIHGYAYFDLDQPAVPVEPVTYPVRVNVTAKKNDSIWNDSGKYFKLQPEGGGTLIDYFSGTVPAGNYVVYDVTESEEGVDTGVSVTVANADKADTEITVYVDYYTVTFHDGDTTLAEKTLLKGQEISRPEEDPSKLDGRFREWVTEDKGSTAHVFGVAAEHETHIYAGWEYPVMVKVAALKDGNGWNDNGRHFMLLPQGSPESAALTELSLAVYPGTYEVYDVTGLSEGAFPTEDMDTGVLVTVESADEPGTDITVSVAYYTVTFYDEKTEDLRPCESGAEPNPQIVLKNGKAGRPGFIPEKDKHEFAGWVSADGTAFDFDSKVDEPKQIFASWKRIAEPRYTVTVSPRKDGEGWNGSGRIFALRREGGDGETVFDLAQVKKGTYRVYDITGGSSAVYRARAAEADLDVKVDDGDTGVTVTVENQDEAVYIDYHTVTFYDGEKAYGKDTPQRPVIVLDGKTAAEPSAPDKAGYRFTGWMTGESGGAAFDFEEPIRGQTDIYAGWQADKNEPDEERKPGGGDEDEEEEEGDQEGEALKGETETVAVVQESVPQAITNETEAATEPGSKEPKTGDPDPVEIYATMAMIAGLAYLLLYFMEEPRGMSEREKEVFVTAFIRWAKKGGRFRKCCALAAIFCLLVYYHGIGKHAYENMLRKACRGRI